MVKANRGHPPTGNASLGYEHEGNLGIPGREAFTWPPGEPRLHLYVCVAGSEPLSRHLLFRDYLRSNPDAARHYGEVKKRAAGIPGEIAMPTQRPNGR